MGPPHDGSVVAHSDVGNGTTIEMTLPIAKTADS
jgi:signal transduction histidine kinase